MDQDFIVGGFYAFQIQPDENDSQINAGKFGVFECIKKFDDFDLSFCCTVVVLDGIFETQPEFKVAKKLRPLLKTELAQSSRLYPPEKIKAAQDQPDQTVRKDSFVKAFLEGPAAFTVYRKSVSKFETHFIGKRLLPSFRRRRIAKYCLFDRLDWVSIYLDNEMRWRFDRENFEADCAKIRERRALLQQQEDQRKKERMDSLTIDNLLTETHLTAWDTRTDFIPPDFLNALRAELLTLLKKLHFTDKKQPKAQVRKNLKAFVEWINVQDEQYGHPIETMEREELHELLEEICHAAKHKSLVDEIENWRDW